MVCDKPEGLIFLGAIIGYHTELGRIALGSHLLVKAITSTFNTLLPVTMLQYLVP